MEFLGLLGKTLLLRPYVFLFLAFALATSVWLMGPKRTAIFFLLTWATAFLCEFSSTRTGIPFGWYFYTDRKSTRLNSSHGYISYAVFCLKKKKRHYYHTY